MSNSSKQIIIFILMVSFASIGAVIPSSSLVDISNYFKITTNEAGSVISIFIFGYAISQLFYGYISHAYGRKIAIYIGSIVAIVGYSICAFSNSYNLLLIGRFLSALGSGCGLTVTFALIADLYKGSEAKKITSYTTSAFAVMPSIAILIGGIISYYFTWRDSFIFMIAYSILIMFLATKIPTTNKHKLAYGMSFSDYMHDLKEYFFAAIVWGLCGGIIYMFSSTLPIITINEFGTSNITFGILYSLSMSGYFLGNIITARINAKFPISRVLYIGCSIIIVSSLIFIIASNFNNVFIYYVPIFLLFISLPMIFSTLLGNSMNKVKNKAISSCITSFSCMTISAIISMIVSGIPGYIMKIEPWIVLLISVLIIVFTFLYLKKETSCGDRNNSLEID